MRCKSSHYRVCSKLERSCPAPRESAQSTPAPCKTPPHFPRHSPEEVQGDGTPVVQRHAKWAYEHARLNVGAPGSMRSFMRPLRIPWLVANASAPLLARTGGARLHAMLALVVKGEALRGALALVVAAALANGVHIAPVRLGLRVLQRVAVHLAPHRD